MVSPFTLPPLGMGPGSQPDPDGELQYMPMPSGMRTYAPHMPETNDPEGLALLERLAQACERAARGEAQESFDLAALTPAARHTVADALGQGEVAMKIRGRPALAVQESVFAGVWMVAGAGVDRVEVGPVPRVALDRAHLPHAPAIGALARRVPGLANGPSVLTELMAKSAAWSGGLAHVVNLSLLPHTPDDLTWLAEALGEGAVTVLSRGYGNCRVTATAQPRVWHVQFFNSMDVLILDTYEVTTLPEVALAAAEDLSDSAIRIRDVIETIR